MMLVKDPRSELQVRCARLGICICDASSLTSVCDTYRWRMERSSTFSRPVI